MRKILLILILSFTNLLHADDFVPVCDRTPFIHLAISAEIFRLNGFVGSEPVCEKITAEDLERITYLAIERRSLSRVRPSDFQGLGNLRVLSLKANKLQDLEPRTFVHLRNLRKLDLSGNELTTLKPEVFFGLVNLNQIDLSNNPLIQIDADTIGEMPSLEHLDHQNTLIQQFPRGICAKTPQLTRILISNSRRLHEIPDFAFADCHPDLEVHLFGVPLTLTHKAAFHGVSAVIGLPADFDQDSEGWGTE